MPLCTIPFMQNPGTGEVQGQNADSRGEERWGGGGGLAAKGRERTWRSAGDVLNLDGGGSYRTVWVCRTHRTVH